jgi:hypothetical protein
MLEIEQEQCMVRVRVRVRVVKLIDEPRPTFY